MNHQLPEFMRSSLHSIGALVFIASLALGALGSETHAADDLKAVDGGIQWNARAAEHLLNRAGFGATPEQIETAVKAGLEATVEDLITRAEAEEIPFYAKRLSTRDGILKDERKQAKQMERDGMEPMMDVGAAVDEFKQQDKIQLQRYLGWWVDTMRKGEDPLGERMTLFWSGWFTSSYRDVKSSFEMISQNQLLRTHGLGRFGDLLHQIARDPAMLEYLDNDANRREEPNENFARELMELFTLGEGNYTEEDVKNAARAFTGWRDSNGVFEFNRRRHDFKKKTILGSTGRFDGDDVIGILLEQEACSEFLARGLIRYFEGVEPSSSRLDLYAGLLMRNEYDIAFVLKKLFQDPDFYRAEVVGTRIAGPIDFLVGNARRLRVNTPGYVIALGSAALGQRLFDPPNVRGWEGGVAWVTTSTLMMRSNLVGNYIGVVDSRADVLDDPKVMKALRKVRWEPTLNLSAYLIRASVKTDSEIADYMLESLLAIKPTSEARSAALSFLADVRMEQQIPDGELLDSDAELDLRSLAHLILSLPEANLN